jgi:hypothetical protein
VLRQILVLFFRVNSRESTSALQSMFIFLDVMSRDDLTAIRMPPPFLLNLLGLFGSGGCESGLRSRLKILYDSVKCMIK